jgi:alpha-beta hydrolase superfamily lysophospholipase
MRRGLLRTLKRAGLLLGALFILLLGLRIYDTQRGPPLEIWHTHRPPELTASALDHTDWSGYLAAEEKAFQDVRTEVIQKIEPEDRVPFNRYFESSPVNPEHFARDWNRSFLLEPMGDPLGAVVLLHGLTDSPYSLRHVAERYRDLGFVAVAPRLPAHGTVPAALTDVSWEDWLATARLAVREARRRVGPGRPLHIVGYSMGGSLALKYALDAIDDPSLAAPDRLVLISPMVGVTAFARFAGLAGLPAILPAFAKTAWLANLPEFNPFKYNSFPVNGARQAYLLTRAGQQQLQRLARDNRLGRLPPILTFQSVLDSTVSTGAVVSELYGRLPANGSELVLFDVNRHARLGLLLRPAAETMLDRLLPPSPRNFRTAVITNANADSSEEVERVTEAGSASVQEQALGLRYPDDVFSLSHVALPFPVSDGLYGSGPDPAENFGVRLGTIAARGETGALIVSLDTLMRNTSNPFFPYLIGRIEEEIVKDVARTGTAAQ